MLLIVLCVLREWFGCVNNWCVLGWCWCWCFLGKCVGFVLLGCLILWWWLIVVSVISCLRLYLLLIVWIWCCSLLFVMNIVSILC